MSKKFTEYNNLDLSQVNKEVLQRWDKEDVFHKSLEIREDAPSFVFYEGPPSANGMPGIHHVIARSIKDIFCRYKTMKGYQVKRKAGWDTHGLPVELGVEKALGITKEDIGKTISVAEYNAACRKDVMKYTKEWEDLTRKMGYWVDMDDPYITYDNRYIETLWYLLKELYKKGLLYKGYTIQPYSPAAGTGLSTHELNQPGCYRDVKDLTCVAMFKTAYHISGEGFVYFLAWTTTPWTLPSNTALCVGADIIYSYVQTINPSTNEPCIVILAKDRISAFFGEKKIENYKVIKDVTGKELAGLEYDQLIPFVNLDRSAFKVVTGDFVTTDDGTGIVHIAPTFGADDDRVAKQNGIPPMLLIDKNGKQVPMVDLTGKFYKIEDLDEDFVKNNVDVESYKDYAGKFVKDAYYTQLPENHISLDLELCIWLQKQGLLFKKEKHTHNYPHCWRTDKPVLYYPLDSWFIRTTACRERMIELNNTINWKPQSTGTGRFGKWLENLQDWNLSRSRYWGTPLPIWRTEDGTEEKCIGSVAELMEEINKSIAAGIMDKNPFANFKTGDYSASNYAVENIDLHRPFVDNIILVSETGKPMKREADLIDVWFDSGAMPYAQIHYPFENKELFDKGDVYPADFIAEGVDQTRGWFFTLHAIAAMVFDSVSFKTVVSNGLVLDKNGNKMSKRLGNAVDPFETIEKYGSDPLRWYMITNASPWDNLKFDVEGIEEARRKFFGTLYNTYSFFALYANVDGFEYKEQDIPFEERPEIDRWILSLLNTLIKEVDEFYSTYEPTRAGRAINDFVNDNLSNWYVRLNRKRFWGGKMDADKLSAYQTLYTCLKTVAQLMAPIAPFYADKLYLDLIAPLPLNPLKGTLAQHNEQVHCTNSPFRGLGGGSVHLSNFPICDESLINKDLEERMQIAQTISSLVLALRRKAGIKVRQPLQEMRIPADHDLKSNILKVNDIIRNEVNVKEIGFLDPSSIFVARRIKPDFKKLGPKCGKNMKLVASLLQGISQHDIVAFEEDGHLILPDVAGEKITIDLADVEIVSEDIPGWLVANEGRLTVALDITITDKLRKEGIARELVNRIQNIRKSNGFEIVDRINVTIQPNEAINEAVEEFNEYIKNQVLADNVILSEIQNGVELDFDDFKLLVKVEKA
ncbi:MAG: isoleucine--tRNA ligase [Candidatus Azobacteroides sp.]|nr:isoleucine--tRNA ligase [Candidatus Azobacteroides sp.]